MNNKGFSLIELLVVIAIIGIISVIGAMNLFGMTEKAKIAVDEANAADVANAAKLYIAENGKKQGSLTIEDFKRADLIEENFDGQPVSDMYGSGPGDNSINFEILDNNTISVKYGTEEAYPEKKSERAEADTITEP